MTQSVLLDNVNHHDLKVITGYSEKFGDNVNQVLTLPTEYLDIQKEYPIFFHRDNTSGEYQSVALLGLDRDENLFLDENGWNATYIPAVRARGPFLIGLQGASGSPMIHVDMDNPRVNRDRGQPVFLTHGGHSPYLERISGILQLIHRGVTESKGMFAAFESCGLIEPVRLELKLNEGEQYTIEHFSTISREKLAALDGAQLEALNRQGYLQLAFHVLASQGNVSRLIELKNRRSAAAVT
ncbi:SapC family protein [Microbulbifer bruguierae]|uniref:SapC family protein n=1 Tax=Microbulbifer bruguierae TaxID=3029061 RepID=A0ABY8NJ36_9GAMM|nr:SapC family protein [Microbulbifer bruguierae]WGL18354.1 SapC family protein [Microbulbifer bruguierae]